jgi:hypothetical protein
MQPRSCACVVLDILGGTSTEQLQGIADCIHRVMQLALLVSPLSCAVLLLLLLS